MVIDVVDFFEFDRFFDVQFLFVFKDTLVEKLLEFFIAVVNAKLFERVVSEISVYKERETTISTKSEERMDERDAKKRSDRKWDFTLKH